MVENNLYSPAMYTKTGERVLFHHTLALVRVHGDRTFYILLSLPDSPGGNGGTERCTAQPPSLRTSFISSSQACLGLVMGLKLEKSPGSPLNLLAPLACWPGNVAMFDTRPVLRGEPSRAISCQLGWWQPQCVWAPSLRLQPTPGTHVLVSSSEEDRLSQTAVAKL